MTAPLAAGGMGLDDARRRAPSTALYTSMVYLTSLPGGWIADRLLGQRRAVLYGGILIALRPLQHGRARRSPRSISAWC